MYPTLYDHAKSWVTHGAIAGAIALIYAFMGEAVIGAHVAIGIYLFRELEQTFLYKSEAPLYDHILDVAVPAAAAISVALIA